MFCTGRTLAVSIVSDDKMVTKGCHKPWYRWYGIQTVVTATRFWPHLACDIALTLWRPLVPCGYSYKCIVCRTGNYKWLLNPVWHRMLYSCTHVASNSGRQRVLSWPIEQKLGVLVPLIFNMLLYFLFILCLLLRNIWYAVVPWMRLEPNEKRLMLLQKIQYLNFECCFVFCLTMFTLIWLCSVADVQSVMIFPVSFVLNPTK